MRPVSDTPPVSPSDPAGWLRARVAELEKAGNARLRQAAADRDELAAAQLAARDAQIEALAARVEELQRLLAKDSSTSSRPPSSDSPYKPPSPWGWSHPRGNSVVGVRRRNWLGVWGLLWCCGCGASRSGVMMVRAARDARASLG